MKNKILWMAIALMFLISFYNAYNSSLQAEQITKLSQRLDWIASLGFSGENETGKVQNLFPAERTIPIVAVSSDGEGVVGSLMVKLIPGNNNVLINTNPFLDADIQYSANKAVTVAKLRSNYSFDRDFIFDYRAGNAQLIGGESAGAAEAAATIAALQNKTIRKDTAVTGTIESDGTIGQVGAVIEKAKAVADAGYKRFLVPKGQSKVTYYERQVSEEPTRFGFTIRNTKYVPKTIDLKEIAAKEWRLEIIETPTIDDALKYLIE